MNNSPVDGVKRVAEIRQTAAWMVEKSNNKAHVESIRFVVNVQNPEKQYLVLRKVLTAYTDFGCSAPPPPGPRFLSLVSRPDLNTAPSG